jgi:hypothetical protein
LEQVNFDRTMSDREKIEFFRKFVPQHRTISDQPRNDCPFEPKIEPVAFNKLIANLFISYKTGPSGGCTGFFVNPRVIATASHCVKRFSRDAPYQFASSVYVSAGYYVGANGVPQDFGGESAYKMLANPKFEESNPGSISARETAEDYAFIILKTANLYNGLGVKEVHKFVQPDFRITSTPPLGGGDPVVISEGKNYELIGYPDVDGQASTLDTVRRTGDSKIIGSLEGKIFSSGFRAYFGNSGGPVRESSNGNQVAGIASAGLCGLRSVAPHQGLLNAYATAEKISSCLLTAQNACLLKCCDGIVSPTSDVKNCKKSCIIE